MGDAEEREYWNHMQALKAEGFSEAQAYRVIAANYAEGRKGDAFIIPIREPGVTYMD